MTDKTKEQIAGNDILGTDLALGGIEATDLFDLGGDFQPQTSSVDTQKTRASAKGANGDEIASQAHDTKTVATATYIYTGATSIDVDNLYIGRVGGGYHIDQVQVAYTNNGWPTVTVNGHNHGSNAHFDGGMVEIKPSLTLPAGFGVCPGLFANAGVASSCVSANYTLSAEHTDVLGCAGEHLAGDNHGGMETATGQYYGIPTLTTTGWVITSSNASDSNGDFDQVSISATKSVARYVAP